MITIINGGTQGLGEAVARKLVGDGQSTGLVLVGRSVERGKALAVMTENLAYALMRHNIRVNQVNPGWMETESEHQTQMTQDGAPENWLEMAAPAQQRGNAAAVRPRANGLGCSARPGRLTHGSNSSSIRASTSAWESESWWWA